MATETPTGQQTVGCLYDGSAEPLTLSDEEFAAALAASEEHEEAPRRFAAAAPFKVITKIRSQNFSPTAQRPMRAPFGITLHHTGGHFAGDLATLTKPASNPSLSVSANDYITKKGEIYELCEFPKRAWHAGVTSWRTGAGEPITDGNSHFWGIEIENLGNGKDPYPQVQIDAIVWRCRERAKALKITDQKMFTRHRDIAAPPGRKTDTSDNFPWAEVRRRVFAADPPPPQPDPAAPIGPDTTLMSAPRGTVEKVAAALLARPNGEYTEADVRTIAGYYFATAGAVGLDPLLLCAQMALETAFLSSAWAARPHCNPAGIGVTGARDVGLSFATWKTSHRAHAGRILAYALPKGTGTPAQQALIEEALSWRPLPDARRGKAKTLAGLAGIWAADPKYATSISAVANKMR